MIEEGLDVTGKFSMVLEQEAMRRVGVDLHASLSGRAGLVPSLVVMVDT
ncbi:MAG TPA: hypothetical protein VGJ50_11880 [Streptosporangiaceae bacterium]